jgi:hypothetical protein
MQLVKKNETEEESLYIQSARDMSKLKVPTPIASVWSFDINAVE